MTTSLDSGTSGEAIGRIGPWRALALAALVVMAVNATSEILEMRGHAGFSWWEPVVWEGSSVLVIAAMAPLIGWAIRRWPPRRAVLARFLLIHLALTAPFAIVHVAAVAVIRNVIYAAARQSYAFFEDGVALRLLYEWRKDVLIYAVIALVYWWFQSEAARRTELAGHDGRIEVRDGSSVLFLRCEDILLVEAMGNYVQFHTSSRTHLVRGALAAWQARLAPRGFVRAHRSRLINRGRISGLKPTPAGDIEITLDDGRKVAGSRRYRGAFASGPGG